MAIVQQPSGTLGNIHEWHRPSKFRTVISYGAGGILQMDIAHFYDFWINLIGKDNYKNLKLHKYGLISIDVYSRLAWGVSLENTKQETIKNGILRILNSLRVSINDNEWKPDIISGDYEITHAMFEYQKVQYKGTVYNYYNQLDEFEGIRIYQTTPNETNKNSIIERFIRTLKWYILRLLASPDLNLVQGPNITEQLIQLACNIHNQRYHRTIKAVPLDVWMGFSSNNQEIKHINYKLLPIGTIVRIRLNRYKLGSSLANKIFHYDFNIYVIIGHRNRKYILREILVYIYLGSAIEAEDLGGPGRKAQLRLFQPYEVDAFSSKRELVDYVRSALFRYQTVTRHGGNHELYWTILNYIVNNVVDDVDGPRVG